LLQVVGGQLVALAGRNTRRCGKTTIIVSLRSHNWPTGSEWCPTWIGTGVRIDRNRQNAGDGTKAGPVLRWNWLATPSFWVRETNRRILEQEETEVTESFFFGSLFSPFAPVQNFREGNRNNGK